MSDPRLAKLADILVNYSARVRKNDLVKIMGSAVTEPLLVEIFKAVLRAGGQPYLAMNSDDATEAFLKLAGNSQLDYSNPILQHEMETIDCLITTWGESNTRALSNVDPAKAARANLGRRKRSMTFMSRMAIPEGKKGRMRWIGTQYPTASAAQDAEMSLAEFEDFVFGAGLLHAKDPAAAWKAVSARQEKVVRFMNKVREVRFRTPKGT